ncbi:MAG TPA: hypothetical protein DEB09_03310 [Candidatus Magasanikbacteria bacterium]|nr:hypothetical protein [Candidatus Magasanikbacteria bacterium]
MPDVPKEELLKADLISFFPAFQEQLKRLAGYRKSARRHAADELFTMVGSGEYHPDNAFFQGYTESEYNKSGFTVGDCRQMENLFTEGVKEMVENIKQDTEVRFRQYFARVNYDKVHPYTAKMMKIPELRLSFSAPGLCDWARRDGVDKVALGLVWNWEGPAPIDDGNVYGLSKENLKFLKPVAKELIEKLLVDAKNLPS